MNRKAIWAAAMCGFVILGGTLSPVFAGQEQVHLTLGAFIERCSDRGTLTGDGHSYVCSAKRATGVAPSVSCVFRTENTTCSWADGSDVFARGMIGATSARGLSNGNLDAAPRVLLPSFAGRRNAHLRP